MSSDSPFGTAEPLTTLDPHGVPDAYTHLLKETFSSSTQLQLALRQVYQDRAEAVLEDANAGLERLQAAHINGLISPDDLEGRAKGLQEITSSLSDELFEEYKTATRALSRVVVRRVNERLTTRVVVGTTVFAVGFMVMGIIKEAKKLI